VLSSSQVYDWCFARQRVHGQQVLWGGRRNVWRNLLEIAEPIGRAETIGRPWLWKLKSK